MTFPVGIPPLSQDDLADAIGAETVSLVSSLSLEIQQFDPAWTGASSDPAIGNGTIAGRYIKLDRLVIIQVHVVAGISTTFGTGKWSFTIPVYPDTGAFEPISLVRATDQTASTTYLGYAEVDANGDFQNIIAHGGSSPFSSSVPFTWASTDSLVVTAAYLTN